MCGVCMEVVKTKPQRSERRFGILCKKNIDGMCGTMKLNLYSCLLALHVALRLKLSTSL